MAQRREKKRIGDILISANVITEEQLQRALPIAKESGKKIGEVLISLGVTSEMAIARALAQQLQMELVSFRGKIVGDEFMNLVGENILRKYVMLPFAYNEINPNIVKVAMADPMDMLALDDFSIITNLIPDPVVATTHDILTVLDKHFKDSEAMRAATQYAKEREEILQRTHEITEDGINEVNNSPVVLLVRTIIEHAARQNASDIHIEALEDTVRVRFRIDGALYDRFSYSTHLLSAIIARIKIIGGMDISEKRKPQDGRITHAVDKIEYDIRVSTLPTVFGEKCVMRLAKKQALTRNKEELGFKPEELKKFDHLLKNPNGILLVTGPTGSGKSTTLYTAIHELNQDNVNIITVEDPVEANIDGVNQVQVNVKADLTFASALRSILRQDPDIIMIGEIRDAETADIAVQASITGHLVVSTLHTNSSAGTLTRLLDMGIESFLLADSMIGVIAQRLVRKLCTHCRISRQATEEELAGLNMPPNTSLSLYEAVGCEHCNQTGYTGRIGIYEIMVITPAIKEMIVKKATTEEIRQTAVAGGMVTLRSGAAKLVVEGITSYHEMMHATYEN